MKQTKFSLTIAFIAAVLFIATTTPFIYRLCTIYSMLSKI